MQRSFVGILPFVALIAVSARAADDFRWEQALPAGQVIEIKGVNGGITARAATGSTALVTAHKHGRRSDPALVEIKVVENASGVTICAVYPTPSGSHPNECAAGDGGRMNSRDNDVSVEFEVQVPSGVRFVGRTVNGGVEAVSLPANAEAYTVNGGVRVEAGGEVQAETVNGSIRASMGRAEGQGPLRLKTVNGGITVELPASASARVHAETVNGSIETDFPLTVQGKLTSRRLDGTIGNGGRELELVTVNGSITLHKGH
jgi:hypothetical protein